ncbi:uncharacterized protein LOC112875586 [Panicum hallii]|jgi:hypothetical protein|uniref:uncharacterized protein LOC112875586 n=1 Tax=Panicum hallii TaxID=206008 RepID=UPI000DF4EEE9|nr:uncharacterized protein LOC112875586 [Panicum hallii]
MAGAVGVWLEAFSRIGRTEAAGAEAGRRHRGDDGAGVDAGGKKSGVVQEKRQRNSGVLSDSDTLVCMLMDRFAPA